MNNTSNFEDILANNPKVVDYNLSGSEKEPEVFFKVNTGNGRHTEKHGDMYEYYRFYQFKGHVKDAEELEYRLKHYRPPHE